MKFYNDNIRDVMLLTLEWQGDEEEEEKKKRWEEKRRSNNKKTREREREGERKKEKILFIIYASNCSQRAGSMEYAI